MPIVNQKRMIFNNQKNQNTVNNTKDIDIVEQNKILYTKNKIQNFLENISKEYGSGGIIETECINTDILLSAPKTFFDKYEPYVERMTLKIQEALSSSNEKSVLISKVKKDPTNKENKKEAFFEISRLFLKLDSELKDPFYTNSFDHIDKAILLSLIVNEICGLGPIEPLFRDDKINEVICNGPFDVQVDIKGVPTRVPSCRFRNPEHLQSLIDKLYGSINKAVARTSPGEVARLHDQSRLFAVHQCVMPQGPSLNIRKHSEDWISPEILLQWGTFDEPLMEWLGSHINAGLSFLVAGGTSTGKTTLLGSLTGFYPNNARILRAEKNIELKGCPNKMWAPAMEMIPEKYGDKSSIGVSMRALVEFTTQMRPDIIVVGEVIDGSCYDLVNALNTGHYGSSTVHANTVEDSIVRVESLISQAGVLKGKSVQSAIVAAFDFIVNPVRFPEDGSRKIAEISEVLTDLEKNPDGSVSVKLNPIWRFYPEYIKNPNGRITIGGQWKKIGELSEARKRRHNLLNGKQLLPLNELRKLYPTLEELEEMKREKGV